MNNKDMKHYEGQYGSFDYDPELAEPIIDTHKAAAYDEESGATLELFDYDKNETLNAAYENPGYYDFLLTGWDFTGTIPEGYHEPRYEDVTIDF